MYEELKARLLAWTKTSSSFGLDSIGIAILVREGVVRKYKPRHDKSLLEVV